MYDREFKRDYDLGNEEDQYRRGGDMTYGNKRQVTNNDNSFDNGGNKDEEVQIMWPSSLKP